MICLAYLIERANMQKIWKFIFSIILISIILVGCGKTSMKSKSSADNKSKQDINTIFRKK